MPSMGFANVMKDLLDTDNSRLAEDLGKHEIAPADSELGREGGSVDAVVLADLNVLITERLKVGIAERSDISNIIAAVDGEVDLIEGRFVVLNDEIIDLGSPFADERFGSNIAQEVGIATAVTVVLVISLPDLSVLTILIVPIRACGGGFVFGDSDVEFRRSDCIG